MRFRFLSQSIVTKQKFSPLERNRLAWLLLALLLFLLPSLYRRVVVSQEFTQRLKRGNEYIEQGLVVEAEHEWLSAERLAPNNPTVLQLLGALYVHQSRPAEARAVLNRLMSVAPNEPHVLCRLAALEFFRGGREMRTSAHQDAIRAAKLEADCIDAQRIAAEVSFWVGEDADGLNYLNLALHLQPDNVPLRLYLISHLVRTYRLPKAIELAQEVLTKNPQAITIHGVLGSLYRHLPSDTPEYQKAESELQIALQKAPKQATFCYELGQWYLSHNQPQKAVPYLETARDNGYQRATVWGALAKAYWQLGDHSASESAAKTAQWYAQNEQELTRLDRAIMDSPTNIGLQSRRSALYETMEAQAQHTPSKKQKFPFFLP